MRGQKGDKGDAWGAVLLEMALPAVYIRVVLASIPFRYDFAEKKCFLIQQSNNIITVYFIHDIDRKQSSKLLQDWAQT